MEAIMPMIPDDFAADIRRALIVRDDAPADFVRAEGWRTLILHREQRRAASAPFRSLRPSTPPDAA